MQFITNVRIADRYYCAILYFIILVALLVVDVMLLKRLKMFYPNFYKKEKGRVMAFLIF